MLELYDTDGGDLDRFKKKFWKRQLRPFEIKNEKIRDFISSHYNVDFKKKDVYKYSFPELSMPEGKTLVNSRKEIKEQSDPKKQPTGCE